MRRANYDDIPKLLGMGVAFAEAIGETYTEGSIEQTFSELIEGGLLLVTENGMLGAAVFPHYLDRNKTVVAEMFMWVDPGHRKGGQGQELLDGLEEWAKIVGAFRVSMPTMTVLNDNIARLYESRGFRKFESTYVKEL